MNNMAVIMMESAIIMTMAMVNVRFYNCAYDLHVCIIRCAACAVDVCFDLCVVLRECDRIKLLLFLLCHYISSRESAQHGPILIRMS